MTDSIYNPEFVRGLFNRMSASYERMNYITSFGFSIRWRRRFLDSLPGTQEKIEIIDLLTGMGETWHAVSKRFPQSRITGLDFSEEMLKMARIKNDRQFEGSVTLLNEDVLKNSLPDNHYDYVICAFGLKTFDNEQLQVLASETRRILKPGGKFSFVEVSRPPSYLLKQLYGFYLGQAIPILGRLFLGNPAEYKMLWQYTTRFENALGAMAIFREAGLKASYSSYFFGCATGFNGRK